MGSSALDWLLYSSLWVALAAAALAWAAGLAMGLPGSPDVVGAVFAGTLCIYALDRLRDRARDRATAPRRTAFVERHASALAGVAAGAGVAAVALAVRVGPEASLVLLPAALLGFLHRRVKHLAFLKSSYLTLAWICVVVAFPAAAGAQPAHLAWVALVIGAGLQANAIASNVRDGEAAVPRLGSGPALRLARLAAAVGIGLGLVAPGPVRSLVWVPALTWLSLVRFQPDERYGLGVVDGALLAGALASVALA